MGPKYATVVSLFFIESLKVIGQLFKVTRYRETFYYLSLAISSIKSVCVAFGGQIWNRVGLFLVEYKGA